MGSGTSHAEPSKEKVTLLSKASQIGQTLSLERLALSRKSLIDPAVLLVGAILGSSCPKSHQVAQETALFGGGMCTLISFIVLGNSITRPLLESRLVDREPRTT